MCSLNWAPCVISRVYFIKHPFIIGTVTVNMVGLGSYVWFFLSIIETEGIFESDIGFWVWCYGIAISRWKIFFRNESGIEEVSLTLKILKFPLYELSNLKFCELKQLRILFLKYSSKLKSNIKFVLHMKS